MKTFLFRVWQMLFNADKCKVMHIGYNNSHADYFMNGNQLNTVSEKRVVGVVVSDDLKWEKQSSEAVKKANRMLGVIKRSFTDRSKETIIPLYKSCQTSLGILFSNMESTLQKGYKVD